jgi:two-component system chemotaxis response regulator CheB
LCVIGASTGGPPALQRLLETLPPDFPLPVVIAQHMPPGFTRPFAQRLNGLCDLRVREAVDGDRIERGTVLIAPAGRHLRITRRLTVAISDEPSDAPHRPSIDLMMTSAAQARPGKVLGILLTGMGDDGADGLAMLRAQGGITIGESEESCVVFGMSRAAHERGAVDRLLPLAHIAGWLAGIRAPAPASEAR